MLRTLSGAVHEVHTGVFMRGATQARTEVVTTRVSFLPMTDDEIAWYVATGEPLDKAGHAAYRGARPASSTGSTALVERGRAANRDGRFLNDLHGPD